MKNSGAWLAQPRGGGEGSHWSTGEEAGGRDLDGPFDSNGNGNGNGNGSSLKLTETWVRCHLVQWYLWY